MEKRLIYGLVVESPDEMEKARVSYYDLDEGIYRISYRTLNQLSLAVEHTLNSRAQREVINYLFLDAKQLTPNNDSNLVVVGNGTFNRKEKKLLPFTPNLIFTHKILTKYNINAKEPTFNGWSISDWIEQLSDVDRDKELLLWQIFAIVVNPNLTNDVAVFLVDNGQGRTGKSTFEQLLENLVGAGNYSSLKLKEFEEDFKLASAIGKALIIGDDNNPNDYNKTSENFKQVATGENVLINPKGERPFNYRFRNFIIQSMNGMPRFKDNTDALFRRFRVVKFNHQYPATPQAQRIKGEYIKDQRLLEYILKRALMIDACQLTDTQESKTAIHEIKLDNDSVAYFLDKYLSELQSTRLPVKFLFNLFLGKMDEENNPQTLKQNTFTKRAKLWMFKHGWTYSRNNLAPLAFWNDKDMKLLQELDNFKYRSYTVDPFKKQPLFERRNSRNENKNHEKQQTRLKSNTIN